MFFNFDDDTTTVPAAEGEETPVEESATEGEAEAAPAEGEEATPEAPAAE